MDIELDKSDPLIPPFYSVYMSCIFLLELQYCLQSVLERKFQIIFSTIIRLVHMDIVVPVFSLLMQEISCKL